MENISLKLDRLVKISIIVGFLIISLSVAYYLVIFLPKKEEMKIEQQKSEQQLVELEKVKNKQLLDTCLEEAEKDRQLRWLDYCNIDNKPLVKEDGTCYLEKVRVDYINERDKEAKDFCFKKYPQN